MRTVFPCFVLFFIFVFTNHIVEGQAIAVPSISSIKKASDFRKNEKKALEIIGWLGSPNSFNLKKERDKAIEFINSYVDKHPYLIYNPSKKINKFRKKSEYALQFKLGWTRYLLTYEYSKNSFVNHKQALSYVLDFYDQNKANFGKNSYLEKIKTKKKLKELDTFITSGL